MINKKDPIANLLQLSKNECQILNMLDNEHSTPLSLAQICSIPRPTIYIVLEKLRARGLVIKKKVSNKVIWQKSANEEIEGMAYNFKRLLQQGDGNTEEKISINDSSQIVVHRGQKAIFKLFSGLMDENRERRMICLQGNLAGYAWSKLFKTEDINIINKKIKRNKIITELVTSKEWFVSQTKLFGIDWAKNFEGRTMRMQNIDDKYLNYSSQIFIIDNKVYIDAMADKVFIEIKNPEISKLLMSLASFVQDHSEVLDANRLLRELIDKNKIN